MKKIYKIIASISVFLIILFVGVALVVGNTTKKANAGVIIEEKLQVENNITMATNGNNLYIRLSANMGAAAISVGNIYYNNQDYSNYRLGYFQTSSINFEFMHFTLQFVRANLGTTIGLTNGTFVVNYIQNIDDATSDWCYISIDDIINAMKNIDTNGEKIDNYGNEQLYLKGQQGQFFRKLNTISSVNNIYDLENKSFCLLYLSDISGIDTAQMRDEITINWGFINNNDNELYAEYSPTISAQNLQDGDDTIIRLGVPLNNSGSAMDYYDVSQKALLSTIDSSQGGATATAHIYGIYIWRNQNMIEWGLAEFDTTSTPTSGATMNYLTSTTRKYQYQNIDTSTMTCRLSVSSNFNFITIKIIKEFLMDNFITIKNQEQVDVLSVNAVIRQGGFMPAWALYNWARGSHSGFTSGEQYGAAQYQQGQPGYDAIFQAGRQAGLNENIGTQTWFMKIFQGVDAFLNIRIFPNITFGVLLGIPFIISVVWFIIRSFRGGGGS